MKTFIAIVLMTVTWAWAVTVAAQDERVLSPKRVDTPQARLVAPKTPSSPKTPANITANPTVLTSAACCLKQCSGGGTCGTKCDVVDSLSACSSNFKFECPSDKGLTCLGSSCSCE